MIDFKKIGEAASNAAAEKPWPLCANEEERYMHMGRAAVAAMIPEAEDGECSESCPFLSVHRWDSDCTVGWRVEHDPITKPGPACPAHKEGGK